MKCTECQNEIPKGSVFCPICGSAQFEETVDFAVQPEPVAESIEEKEEPVAELPEKPRLKVKKKWWILAVAGLLLAAVAAVVIFTGRRPGYGAYYAGGSTYLTDLSDGEPVMLMEYGSCTGLVMTEDQNHLFYQGIKAAGQGRGLYHLNLRTASGEPELLAENVSLFYVNDKGTRVAYLRDGKLYVHDMDSEKLIAESVVSFLCDEDFDTFAYSQGSFVTSGQMAVIGKVWYFKDGDAQARVLGDGGTDVRILHLAADGKRMVYSVGDRLYVWENDTDTLIAENANVATSVYEDGSFCYCGIDAAGGRKWYFYNGEKSIEIAATANAGMIPGTQPMLSWQDASGEKNYVSIRDRVLEIPLKNADGITLSEDGRRICITSWGDDGKRDLYCASLSSEGLGQLQLLAQDERHCQAWFVGERLYYWTGEPWKQGTLYCDGEKILQDVKMELLVHPETGTLLVPGKETSKFETEVFMVRHGEVIQLTDKGRYLRFASNGDALVGLNSVGDIAQLWCFDRNGKGKLLAEDVTRVLAITKPARPGSQDYGWIYG